MEKKMNEERLLQEIEILRQRISELEKPKKSVCSSILEKSKNQFSKRVLIPGGIVLAFAIATIAVAATIPNTFNDGDVIEAAAFNANFSYIIDRLWDLSGSDLSYTAGNIGVGTTTPNFYDGMGIHINNTAANFATLKLENPDGAWELLSGPLSGGFGLYDSTAPGYRLFVDTAGKVGIGKTNPGALLDVEGEVNIKSGSALRWPGAHSASISGVDNSHLAFAAGNNGDERMRIDSDGLGIGTTDPEDDLHVVGTVKMLGTWSAKSLDTNIQAPSDGFVQAVSTSGDGYIYGYTDSATTPTILRAQIYSASASGKFIMMPVRNGDYWRVEQGASAVVTVYWIPLGI
jgi:hypothetical protein